MPTAEELQRKLSMRDKEITWLSDLEHMLEGYNDTVKPIAERIEKDIRDDDEKVAQLSEDDKRWEEMLSYSFAQEVPPVLGDPLGFGNHNAPADNPVTTKLRRQVADFVFEATNRPPVVALGDVELTARDRLLLKDAVHIVAHRKHEKEMLSQLDITDTTKTITCWKRTRVTYEEALDMSTKFDLNDWLDVHGTLLPSSPGLKLGPVDLALQWFNAASDVCERDIDKLTWSTLRDQAADSVSFSDMSLPVVDKIISEANPCTNIETLRREFIETTGQRISTDAFSSYFLSSQFKKNKSINNRTLCKAVTAAYCYKESVRVRLQERRLNPLDYVLMGAYTNRSPESIRENLRKLAIMPQPRSSSSKKKEKREASDTKQPAVKRKKSELHASMSHPVEDVTMESPSQLTKQTAGTVKCLGLPFHSRIPNYTVSKLHTRAMGVDTTIPSISPAKAAASELCSLLAGGHEVTQPGFVAAWNAAAEADLKEIEADPTLQEQLTNATECTIAPLLTAGLCSAIGNVVFAAAQTCREVCETNEE